MAQWLTNPTSIHEDKGALLSGLRIPRCTSQMKLGSSVGVWCWLWCRQAATAPIGPLAGEPPYDPKRTTDKKKKKKKKKEEKGCPRLPLPHSSSSNTRQNGSSGNSTRNKTLGTGFEPSKTQEKFPTMTHRVSPPKLHAQSSCSQRSGAKPVDTNSTLNQSKHPSAATGPMRNSRCGSPHSLNAFWELQFKT